MSVAHDAESESHTGTTGSASEASFTWNHVPTGTPRSALVFVMSTGSGTDPTTGVTYDGVAMTAVPYIASTAGGAGFAISAYFLDNCSAGTKAVVVSRTNNATVMYAVCFTQTAASAAEVYLPGVMTQGGNVFNTAASSSDASSSTFIVMAVDDGSPGTNSQRYMGYPNSRSSVLGAATGSTVGPRIDLGATVVNSYRETTPGQGARNVGNIGDGPGRFGAQIGLAVREAIVSSGFVQGSIIG